MKIFVFGTRGFPNIQGGVEKHCEGLYPEMPHSYSITVFRRKPFLPKNAKEEYKGVRFIDLISTKIKGFEPFFHSFLCTIICIVKRPDIVHIHNIGPGMFIPLLKMAGLSVVLTYHSPNYEHDKWGKIEKKILKVSEWLSTRWADRIIFVNKNRMNSFNSNILQKSVFIPNGVSVKERSVDTDYITSFGLQAGKYILSVGRITREKGFDYLITAFLKTNVPGYKLVIAGEADHASVYVTNIKKEIRASTTIVETGYIDGEQLRQLYSHAALFALASYNEGFSLALLEAISYRLPVLVSDISANKLIKLEDSDYFKVGDVMDLSKGLLRKLGNKEQSSNYDLSLYSWDTIARQTSDVFRSVTK